MSFSGNVKEELSRIIPKGRHCQIAELAGILSCLGKMEDAGEYIEIRLETENVVLAKKFFELLKKAFQVQPRIAIRKTGYLNNNRIYMVTVFENKEMLRIIPALKMQRLEVCPGQEWMVKDSLLQKSCCKRAFIRGVFLASGSLTDPEKGYHFEIVCSSDPKAEQLKQQLAFFGIEGKTLPRKGHVAVYINEGSQLVDALHVLEAHNSLMELENVRILKEVRNSVNRKVNCETANINKTVSAAVKQIEDIEYIKKHMGLDGLSPALSQVAQVRLQYPEAPLKELGEMLNPPVGKSGVNHRLRKLSEIADQLRG